MFDFNLTPSELNVLAFINTFSTKLHADKVLTLNSISYKLKISEKTVSRAIKHLIQLKLVHKFVTRNSTFYVSSKKQISLFDEGNKLWVEKN